MVQTEDHTTTVASPPVDDRLARSLGERYVAAVVNGDFDGLQAVLAPDIRFRALVPRRTREAATAADARQIVEGWFRESEDRVLLQSSVDVMSDRLVFTFRMALTEEGERNVVEQHVAAIVGDGVLDDIALVCSGSRPATHGAVAARLAAPPAVLDATGTSCSSFTPAIRSALLALDPGGVLQILSDDPAAEADLGAWTRLTGHELVGSEAGPGASRRFTVRRSAAVTIAAPKEGHD